MSVSDGDLGLIRFIQFRKRYLKAIERALEKDDHHKSYEGQMLVEVYWPDYFHDNEMLPSEVVLKIDCYVLGPNRSYVYHGNTLGECLDKAEVDLVQWELDLQESS